MGAVARQAHLHKRGEVYYCRIALPKSLAFIMGRSEYKKSLKTSDLRVARIRCRELSNRMEAFFIMVKALRPDDKDKYIDIINFLDQITDWLIGATEILIVNLCASNMQPFGTFETGIIELPPEQRRQKHVKFHYGIRFNDQWQRLG